MDMQLHNGKEHIPGGQVDVPTVSQFRRRDTQFLMSGSPAQGPGRKGLAGLTCTKSHHSLALEKYKAVPAVNRAPGKPLVLI